MKHRAICCINGDSGQWRLSEMFLKLVFAYCTSEHLGKVPDTAMSMLQTSPSPHFLQRQPSPTGLSYHCWISLQVVTTFINVVLYHMWVCSIILKSTLQLFLHCGHFNWYLQHHSVGHGEPLLYGEIWVSYEMSKYKFNTCKWAAKNRVQFFQHGDDTPKILTLQQLKKTAPNSRSSGVGILQLYTNNMFIHFVVWTSLNPLSYYNGSQTTQNK